MQKKYAQNLPLTIKTIFQKLKISFKSKSYEIKVTYISNASTKTY